MKFYRFNLDTSTEYEAVRATVDAALDLTAPATCIQPYASGPTDQRGRVVLSISTDTPGYSLLVTQFAAVVAAGKARELTQDEYDYSLEPPVGGGGGGGGVSSWNDLTDRPFESVGTGLGVSSGTVSVAYGTTAGTACEGNDARLSDARTPTSHFHSGGDITTGTVSADRLPVVLERSDARGNSGATITLALGAGSVQTMTLSANCVVTMPAATSGASITLIVTQGGGFTATFAGVLWAGGTAPTITATANAVDVLVFVSDGANWFGTAAQGFA